MLTPYRRHKKGCKFTSRRHKGCGCPIWVQGSLDGVPLRQSLDLTNWEAAQRRLRDWEIHGKENAPTLLEATERFIADATANGRANDTVRKYELIKREFETFFGDIPLRSLTLDDISKFRASWKVSNITALKKIQRLRGLFSFCVARGWMEKNPAKGLTLPKENHLPTLPFSAGEWEKIRWAINLYPDRPVGRRHQVLAFILLLRYTGLRIRDVACLERTRIDNGRVFLYTQKTGTPVLLPLHEDVVEALGALPLTRYFFWSGNGNPKSAVADWQRTLRKLFSIAGITNGHAHRFRDSFAVELLLKEVSLENVATFLGNTIRVAEKHYSSWVKTRQDALEAAVKGTW